MTVLWRISNHCDLIGLGGERTNGRWHTSARGKRIIYLSEHPALALIEALANLKGDPALFPGTFQLMKVVGADSIQSETVDSRSLPKQWREDERRTRSIGDSWLKQSDSALLRVPSAPLPESSNFLLNPLHRDAATLNIEWCAWIDYDKRLFHVSAPIWRSTGTPLQ